MGAQAFAPLAMVPEFAVPVGVQHNDLAVVVSYNLETNPSRLVGGRTAA